MTHCSQIIFQILRFLQRIFKNLALMSYLFPSRLHLSLSREGVTNLSYKQIKWLILTIPTLTIGLWELVRHHILLPYISMELGNWLSPVIVFIVSMTFLVKLFAMIERWQEELHHERTAKATLEERERIARELHDGIAQSLFLLSVKITKLEKNISATDEKLLYEFKETIRRVDEDVRQAIANLRFLPTSHSLPWTQTVQDLIQDFHTETGISVSVQWEFQEEFLSSKEKVGLFACLRESLMNIRKHADARHVSIQFFKEKSGWCLMVEDDGRGFTGDPFSDLSRYGLRMVRERAGEMGWNFQIERVNGRTRIEIRKENR